MRHCEPLLKVSEAAGRLNVSEACIRRWILEESIARIKVGRRLVRIPASEIERILREGLIPAKAGK